MDSGEAQETQEATKSRITVTFPNGVSTADANIEFENVTPGQVMVAANYLEINGRSMYAASLAQQGGRPQSNLEIARNMGAIQDFKKPGGN